MSQRRRMGIGGAIAAIVLLLGGVQPGRADTPAPQGKAEATAARIGQLVTLARSRATTGPSDSEAEANSLEIQGKAPAGQFGGKAKRGEGKKRGQLAQVGDEKGGVRLFGWDAEATGNDAERRAQASAAVLRFFGPAAGLQVHVLESSADARHTNAKSTGSSVSNGGRVVLGQQLQVEVLHSEVTSDGKGTTYLVRLNSTKVGETSGQCSLTIPSLVSLTCLAVSGGEGTTGDAAATVFAVAVTAAPPLSSEVVAARASRGVGTTSPAAELPAADDGPAGATGGELPKTGMTLLLESVAALALGAIGAVLVALAPRLRRRTV